MSIFSLNRILILGVAASASIAFPRFHANAQQIESESPQLVIGITIDGLSTDYLDLLQNYFGEKGFRYILDNGVIFQDMDYGTALDAVACNAIVHTGAAPSINGVPASYVYDSTTHRKVPVFNSDLPSAADENYSPAALLSTTLSDELTIAGGGLGHSHSIAPDASMAVVGAGHASNSAFWINDVSGKWTTSSYYQDRPVFLQYRNRMQPVDSRLDTLVWKPVRNLDRYPGLNSIQKAYPFSIRFPYGDRQRYVKYKSSPTVNDEVTDVAIEYIKGLELGRGEQTDMLNVAFTVQAYPLGTASDEKMQIIDGYYRLDDNLARLFQAVDDNVGLDRTLFFIAGTPPVSRSRKEDEKWRVPTGEFSPKKAISLLNLYLINKLGNGEWISGYSDGYFYINGNTASEHNKSIEEVRAMAASFLKKMAGVAYAYTIDEIADRKVHDNALAESRNVRHDATGDVRLTVAPGWIIVDDNEDAVVKGTLVERMGQTTAPAFLLYPALEKTVIEEVIDARALAPTVASVLRIRPPNGASLPPVRLKRMIKSNGKE